MTQTLPDSTLIQRSLSGDRHAFQTLCEQHRRRVYALAYSALGNADDAQDVAQEAFVYVWQRLPELRDTERFSGWLRTLTITLCANYRRRRGTRKLGEPITVLNEQSEEKDYLQRMMLQKAIAHLSEAQRTTFLLHYGGGWSLEEIGELLDVPLNTVRSRLMSAKRLLRSDLTAPIAPGNSMKSETLELSTELSTQQLNLIMGAFPQARILSLQRSPEPWMPIKQRAKLSLTDGSEKTVDLRDDITPLDAELYAVLNRLGIPCARSLSSPMSDGRGGFVSLCEMAKGENLLLWALGGTPHRIRLATERTFEAIGQLQGITDALLADPVGAKLARKTLAAEAETLTDPTKWEVHRWLRGSESKLEAWSQDKWFRAARETVQKAVEDIKTPLVFTNYLHFFPNFVRIAPGDTPTDTPIAGTVDPRYKENPIVEFVSPFGEFSDPLLGLTMVWIYDCYPFVHTGFVEQYLWRHDVSKREFAPRLALRALQTLARECSPPQSDPEPNGYRDALIGYVEQALGWM